ncbi:hypothetical protein GCM10010517_37100 [Streptosporangium fragile]|uniref:Uncharacterized protein n=1 Tax=Streptosporangium fragile TaxID=46186 RepID=A0ABP6II23_9ACTN
MARPPYTYLRASIDGGVTRLAVSLYTADVGVLAAVTSDRRPFLDLSTSEAQISISTTGGGPVTAQDVALAREIVTAATRYLADCEHLHAEQSPQADRATA